MNRSEARRAAKWIVDNGVALLRTVEIVESYSEGTFLVRFQNRCNVSRCIATVEDLTSIKEGLQ